MSFPNRISAPLRVLALVAANWLLLEALLQGVHLVYPLEMPKRLEAVYRNRWIQGFDTYNGRTRLYNYQPGSTGSTNGHPMRFNRWGFRGAEFQTRADAGPGAFRIMALGDSCLMGQGVAEEDRLTERLAAALQQERPGRPVEVINLGVQGFETLQQYKMMRIMGEAVGPNLVMVAFWVNDPNLHYDHYKPFRFPLKGFTSKLRGLITVRLAERAYDRIWRRFKGIPTHEEEVDRAYDPASEDWKIFAASVRGIAEWSRKKTGRAPVVLYLADPAEGRKRGKYESVRRVFEQSGFDWLEIPTGRYRPVSRFDFHPSAATHALYAEVLKNYLTASGALEPE